MNFKEIQFTEAKARIHGVSQFTTTVVVNSLYKRKSVTKMKIKRIISTVLMFVMLITLSINVSAGDKPVTVHLDGNQLEFDVNPIIDNGRTLVPMRKIFESLGATVDWIDETRTAIAVKGDIKIEISIGKYEMFINSKSVPLDVPAQLIDGRTLVPARAVSEGLQAKVDWNEDLWRVIIISKEGANTPQKVYEAWQLHPGDAQVVKDEKFNARFFFSYQHLPDDLFVEANGLAPFLENRDEALCSGIELLWDLYVANTINKIQLASNYTYNFDALEGADSQTIVDTYRGLLQQLGMRAEDNFTCKYDKTPGGKTVLLIDFLDYQYGKKVEIATKYIAVVPINGGLRYFTANDYEDDTGYSEWIFSEFTKTQGGDYGALTEEDEETFLGAIDEVIDGNATVEMYDR